MYRSLALLLFIALACVAASAQCRALSPASAEGTRRGANIPFTESLPKTYKSIHGSALQIHGKPLRGVFVELFDKPELIKHGHTKSPAEQRRVAACETHRDGKFGFRELPPGEYELRLSIDGQWNVVHLHIKVAPQSRESVSAPIRIIMSLGI